MRNIGVGHFESSKRMMTLIQGAMDDNRISYGPLCKLLERKMAYEHESEFGVVSASGTDSLRAALHAMKIVHGWSDGDEIIVPATTFVATVNIVLQLGLKPVLVDVVPVHYTIDPSLIEDAISDRTRAIIPVNLLGQAAHLKRVVEIARKHGLKVLEDSCEAMFAFHNGRSVGSWGDIGCFSFYMAHLVTAGVGGIAVTSNHEYRDVMRSLLNHGRDTIYVSIDDDDGLQDDSLRNAVRRRFHFKEIGYSSRMTELQAALAIPQIESRDVWMRQRADIAALLTASLREFDGLILPHPMPFNTHGWMMYGITITGGDKWPLVYSLEADGIETRELLPLINQPVYMDWFNRLDYPVSSNALDSAFYIGCHQGMSAEDVLYIRDSFEKYFSQQGA